jgi:hypothetical protein
VLGNGIRPLKALVRLHDPSFSSISLESDKDNNIKSHGVLEMEVEEDINLPKGHSRTQGQQRVGLKATKQVGRDKTNTRTSLFAFLNTK